MRNVELLIVEDCFSIRERGIVLIPDFPVPDGWQDRIETVTVVKPGGERYETSARLDLTHFNIADPEVPFGRRWRVVVILPDRAQADVPTGSAILGSPDLRTALLGGEAT